jgi:succinate dehydrogenase / fumarate reductase cytochrome b subunit
MHQSSRPLSPHLQIYRPQLTSVLSIVHRGTGIFLSIGSVLLVFWLLALAQSSAAFAIVQSFDAAWYGQLLLLGWTFSLVYHLLNGVRHLGWDGGWGLDIPRAYATGWTVVFLTFVLTGAIWAFVLLSKGGVA